MIAVNTASRFPLYNLRAYSETEEILRVFLYEERTFDICPRCVSSYPPIAVQDSVYARPIVFGLNAEKGADVDWQCR